MSRPTLFNKKDPYADMYATRTEMFAAEGRAAGLRPASKDGRKVAFVVVDMQFDFVHPEGTLSVPGSQDDTARMVDFIYDNVEAISSIIPSLDTHYEFAVFFNTWWAYMDTGEHPDPFTMISLNQNGEAVDQNGRRVLPLIDPRWTLGTYLPQLKANANKDLMIWPFHCLQGTQGHVLMPALREALSFYSAARLSQIQFLVKGVVPQVEHYGIFAPEVMYPKNPNGGINTQMLDTIAQHDVILVGGEAKSHCVIETMNQMLGYFANQPDVIRSIRFVKDLTSSVVHPAVDFDAIAEARLAEMEQQGVQMVLSTDPI